MNDLIEQMSDSELQARRKELIVDLELLKNARPTIWNFLGFARRRKERIDGICRELHVMDFHKRRRDFKPFRDAGLSALAAFSGDDMPAPLDSKTH